MTLHPSRFPKRADGTRFVVSAIAEEAIVRSGNILIARCPSLERAQMVAAALEFQARDGETFPLEEEPKP